jgi:hypothetical protein
MLRKHRKICLLTEKEITESWILELGATPDRYCFKLHNPTASALATIEGTHTLSVLWARDSWQDIPRHPSLRVLCAPYGFNVRHLRFVHPRLPPNHFEHHSVFRGLLCQYPVELTVGGDGCRVVL